MVARVCISIFLAVCFSSCYQITSEDDLRTVPVTNNPNIVPAPSNPLSPIRI